MATKMKGKTKKVVITILSIAMLASAIIGLFGYVVPLYYNAKNLGISIGDRAGKTVGNVIGSFNGITTGLAEGSEDGKEEGLSAKDIKSDIRNRFSEVGNLEVLEAGVKIKDVNKKGDDYAALFLIKGVAHYSVNLKEMEIYDVDSSTVEILLPEVKVEVFIDESATEKLAEYQKHSWSGSAEDGFTEYMNTREAADQSIKEVMENYDDLKKTAENAAINQVGIIAKAATGNKKDVVVMFKKEVQGDEQ